MKQYIVDVFADSVFQGNPVAVCIQNDFLSDSIMKNIARENNYSDTVFVRKDKDTYSLKCFTPGMELDFSVNAVLGAAFVITKFLEKNSSEVSLQTIGGDIVVKLKGNMYEMFCPQYHRRPRVIIDYIEKALGVRPLEAYQGRGNMFVLPDEASVLALCPDQEMLKELKGFFVIVTALSSRKGIDCVSRVFSPILDISEQQITGDSCCMLTPYWCNRLGKNELICQQLSERGGTVHSEFCDGLVKVSGKVVLYSRGDILEE